jgi:hypothetical protein
MPTVMVFVVAANYEMDRLRRAAAAAGGMALGAEGHDDFAQVTAGFQPDAVIVADGGSVRDPLATLRRLRAAAGAHVPVVFVGAAQAAGEVERFVDATFRRPLDPDALVARAVALTLHPSRAVTAGPRGDGEDATPGLRRVAASIDDTLNAEMLTALRDAIGGVPEPAPLPDPLATPPPVLIGAAMDEVGVPGLATVDPSLSDLFIWADLVSADEETPPWIADRAPATSSRAGDLADVDLAMLLGRLYVEGTTGRLVVTAGTVAKTIYLEAGRPVFAASSDPADRLIEMLVRKGRVTAAQYQVARQAAEGSRRKMGAVLVDLGLIKTTELLPAIRQHYEELVLSLFAWTAGSWRLEPGVMASPTQIRLLRHPAALVREGLRRGYPPERLRQRLGSARNVFSLDLRGTAPDLIADIATDEIERLVPLLFDGVRPLEEVTNRAGLPPSTVEEIALCLWAFGLLESAATAGEQGRGAALPVRDRDIERERILTRHALAVDGDYFEVLGLPRRASAEEVRRAYEVLCQELAPGVLGLELGRTLAPELAMIREVLEEALRVLTTEALRVPYEAALPPERSFDPDDAHRLIRSTAAPTPRRSGAA